MRSLIRSLSSSLAWAVLLHSGVAYSQTSVTPLVAGQHTEIGEVRCAIDPRNDQRGSCEAQTTGGWCLVLAHLFAGSASPATLSPGQFPFRAQPGGCVNTLRVDFSLPAACVGDPVKMAFHAEARLPARQQEETAWAKGASAGQNWSMGFDLPCRPIDN